MSEIMKPNSPLKLGGGGLSVYPLTSSDQIILPDGSRWDAEAPISIEGGGTGAATIEGAKQNLGLATVATSGSYNDLTNTPSIFTPLDAYPVGAIYQSYESTSPASLFGGTWTQLTDRFLVGAGSSYAVGATGGEKTHKLTVEEMPNHAHGINTGCGSVVDAGGIVLRGWSGDSYKTLTSGSVGGSVAHNNMPPYLAVYMWRRTA